MAVWANEPWLKTCTLGRWLPRKKNWEVLCSESLVQSVKASAVARADRCLKCSIRDWRQHLFYQSHRWAQISPNPFLRSRKSDMHHVASLVTASVMQSTAVHHFFLRKTQWRIFRSSRAIFSSCLHPTRFAAEFAIEFALGAILRLIV